MLEPAATDKSTLQLYFLPQHLPAPLAAQAQADFGADLAHSLQAYQSLLMRAPLAVHEAFARSFPKALSVTPKTFDHDTQKQWLFCREHMRGVSPVLLEAVSIALGVPQADLSQARLLLLTAPDKNTPTNAEAYRLFLEKHWREPAIEEIKIASLDEWLAEQWSKAELLPSESLSAGPTHEREDISWQPVSDPAAEIGLDFSAAELEVLNNHAERRGRALNRAEWELFAQTWSEHCKHKIFAARIEGADGAGFLESTVNSLFRSYIKLPTDKMIAGSHKDIALSVFHDNAGVLRLFDVTGQPTPWAFCLKMETHNSPSAISPYGGASTGLVGVHRDIMGTGLGAKPIANWNVLCFESPEHSQARPESALPADMLRLGVLQGIQDGGNQSGIPTVQGSVCFDPSYAVKPLVFAGAIGVLHESEVNKKPKAGLKLYCVGGAVGADGLRGAVMSSRDLRSEDFVGSSVQVANAFVQRRLSDFLLEAKAQGLIDVITDNGAGGLASSVGEMADLSGGASIDLDDLRVKAQALMAWEKLLSESQERMTVATARPEAFEALAKQWQQPFDRLGELNDSGHFTVHALGRELLSVPLELLHDSCPQMQLSCDWSREKEAERRQREENQAEPQQLSSLSQERERMIADFSTMLGSDLLCSRERIAERFDHEVQGRNLRVPFGGRTQQSPAEASLLEIYEHDSEDDNKENNAQVCEPPRAAIVLSHGLCPWREDIEQGTFFAFDEALRAALIGGAQLKSLGALDNFSWPDPLNNPRRLWQLVKACEALGSLCEYFGVPLISGKDSMKNNSAEFAVRPTLVISMGGSSHAPENLPASFFSRANDILFYLRPLAATLQESAWERVRQQGHATDSHYDLYVGSPKWQETMCALKQRYTQLEPLIAGGKVRSARDISEGGLLMAPFEGCLGRELGVLLEQPEWGMGEYFQEGLGGIVLGVDPHEAAAVQAALPEAERLGVVMAPFEFSFSGVQAFPLKALRDSYRRRGREGFWG